MRAAPIWQGGSRHAGFEPGIQAAPFDDYGRADLVHDEIESGSAYFWAFPGLGDAQ